MAAEAGRAPNKASKSVIERIARFINGGLIPYDFSNLAVYRTKAPAATHRYPPLVSGLARRSAMVLRLVIVGTLVCPLVFLLPVVSFLCPRGVPADDGRFALLQFLRRFAQNRRWITSSIPIENAYASPIQGDGEIPALHDNEGNAQALIGHKTQLKFAEAVGFGLGNDAVAVLDDHDNLG